MPIRWIKEKFANVVIIEKPIASPLSVSPKLIPNVLLGTFLGGLLGIVIAFFRSVFAREGHVAQNSQFASQMLHILGSHLVRSHILVDENGDCVVRLFSLALMACFFFRSA